MKIEVEGVDSLDTLRLSHKGDVTVWDAGVYDRPAKGNVEGMFREINSYWATLPENRQDAIWNIYCQIKETFETVFDTSKLHGKLVGLCKELMDQHPMDEIKYWINVKSDLRIPSSMKESYGPNDPRDRTYLRADYAGLMILALNVRPMVPVWGEYIRRIKDESGTNYKEYVAMGLLARSHLIQSQPFERLRVYVEASVNNESVTMSSVLGGLGSTELPDWLLSLALVRKVALVDIGESDDKDNIISNVYRIIRNSLDTLNRKFSGAVNEKRRTMESADEDNSSLAETYKVKQEISDGDLVMLSVYTEDLHRMASRVDPTIDLEKVDLCYQRLMTEMEMEIVQHHLTLTQWCLKPALSPRGIPSLNKPSLLRSMAVTQALLWHWGFSELALLSAAAPITGNRDTMLGVMESRARIPKELVARLIELYPHYQNIGSKQASEKQLNPACKAVEILSKTMTKSDWLIVAPAELINSTNYGGSKRMIAPADIRAQLAKLVIHIAERERFALEQRRAMDQHQIQTGV